VCANDGSIVTRKGAKEFSKWNKFNASKERYDQSQQDGAIVEEERQKTERLRRVCAKGSAAWTIIKIVFMIDIHIHAYDYLLSH
jgi:hypothetical protein